MRKMIMVGGCAVRRLSVSNTLSTRVCIHTRVARGQDGVEVKSMMDLVLVKEVMLRYVHDLRALTEIGRGLSDHYVVLCKVMLLGLWIKRREVVNGGRRIRSEKLREHRYTEGYAKCLEIKRVVWDESRNVEQMWGQLK